MIACNLVSFFAFGSFLSPFSKKHGSNFVGSFKYHGYY